MTDELARERLLEAARRMELMAGEPGNLGLVAVLASLMPERAATVAAELVRDGLAETKGAPPETTIRAVPEVEILRRKLEALEEAASRALVIDEDALLVLVEWALSFPHGSKLIEWAGKAGLAALQRSGRDAERWRDRYEAIRRRHYEEESPDDRQGG